MSYICEVKVVLDSRLIQPGDYFVPVVGEEDDGHRYIDDAIKRGAAGVIAEDKLYQLAREKLNRISPKVVAITGSVGKTTVREFVATVLAVKYQIAKGTLNTKLGLASSIINDVSEGDEFFVAETGMDRPGELKATGEFIKPDAAVITNISESHMEKLGSIEKITQAKAELLQVLPKNGVAFLNWENEHVRSIAHLAEKVVTYGLQAGDVTAEVLLTDLPVIGRHNRLNAVGAYAVGEYFGLSKDQLEVGLSRLRSPKGRLNKLEGINNSIIFDDTYNSSPVSAVYALESVAKYYINNGMSGCRIAILGGMLELGAFEDEGHRIVGEKVMEYGFDELILVGELARKIMQGVTNYELRANTKVVGVPKEAAQYVKNELRPQDGDVILVKASQGIRLEKAVEQLLLEPKRASELLVRQDARWKAL